MANTIKVSYNPSTGKAEIIDAGSSSAKVEQNGAKVTIKISKTSENDYIETDFDDSTETSQTKDSAKKSSPASSDGMDYDAFKQEVRDNGGSVYKIVKNFGYKKLFKILDENGDDRVSSAELSKLGAGSVSELNPDDLYDFKEDYNEKRKTEKKEQKEFVKTVELLKQYITNSNNAISQFGEQNSAYSDSDSYSGLSYENQDYPSGFSQSSNGLQNQYAINGSGADVVSKALQYDGYSAVQMQRVMQQKGSRFDKGLWCADFVTFITKEVYGNNTPANYTSTCPNTASCSSIQNWAKENNLYTTNLAQVQPGDYVLYGSPASHIGIVTSINSDGSVNTIEGNTTDDGGNYGSGHVNQHHNVRDFSGFVLMHNA